MLDHLRAIKNGLVNVSEAKAVVADAKRLRRLLGPAVAIVVVAVSAEQVPAVPPTRASARSLSHARIRTHGPALQHRRTHACTDLHARAHARTHRGARTRFRQARLIGAALIVESLGDAIETSALADLGAVHADVLLLSLTHSRHTRRFPRDQAERLMCASARRSSHDSLALDPPSAASARMHRATRSFATHARARPTHTRAAAAPTRACCRRLSR